MQLVYRENLANIYLYYATFLYLFVFIYFLCYVYDQVSPHNRSSVIYFKDHFITTGLGCPQQLSNYGCLGLSWPIWI